VRCYTRLVRHSLGACVALSLALRASRGRRPAFFTAAFCAGAYTCTHCWRLSYAVFAAPVMSILFGLLPKAAGTETLCGGARLYCRGATYSIYRVCSLSGLRVAVACTFCGKRGAGMGSLWRLATATSL